MFEAKLTIEAPALTEAMNRLAAALLDSKTLTNIFMAHAEKNQEEVAPAPVPTPVVPAPAPAPSPVLATGRVRYRAAGTGGEAVTPEKHAVLSASSSARWLHCTPSARLAEQLPDDSSSYAAAGTLAHSIAELKARKYFLEPMSAKAYNAQMERLKASPDFDKGMDAATDMYLDYLRELAFSFGSTAPFVALENRVDYSDWAPGGFGTADCLMIGGGKLCVCDYKNGAGVDVAAEENSQMMLYALGALKVYGPIYGGGIQDIHLAIIQPNAGGVKTWGLTREELEHWGETVVKPAAALAWAGEGDFCPGPWCEKSFCPARATCTARARKLLELGGEKKANPDAALLSDEQVGQLLLRIREEGLAAWIKDLED